MEGKKGQFNSFIQDAIRSMSADSEQKPVNIPTDYKTRFNEKVDNMSRGRYLDLSKDSGFRKDKRAGVELSGEARTSPIDYIKWFSELNNKDVKIAGGKGASLGEMFNNKFPVPLGFVVTAQSFEYLISRAGLKEKISEILSEIDYEDTEDLNKASAEIRGLIEDFEMPKDLKKEILESYHILGSEKIDGHGISDDAFTILKNAHEPIFVSIRSSATTEDLANASFAGQQETFLNVKGDSQVIEKVIKCFSSLYTPRAIYYRHKKEFKEDEALLAVVVQRMVDSEKSGVVFSKNPVGDEDIVIEAVFGLGEGVVGGKIKPDHYLISGDLEIKNMRVADKKIAIVRTGSGENEVVRLSPGKSKSQVLSRGEIKEIADYAVKLEEHYDKPQDIEFALEAGEVYILQSRPITTLDGEKKKSGEISGNVILEGQSASPGVGTGIVKVVKNMSDLPKIRKGDVLVTEMTNPDMVVAMQKSSAIVTDEGGVTSHAAIVSREMGIPCIVGTENATSVLKDGMRITVDGSTGKIYEGEVAESKAVEIKPAVETFKIKLKVIVDLPDFASRAAETGIDSVGLTRLEGIIASMKKHPLQYEKEGRLEEYSEIIAEGLGKILEHFNSIWFRASDLRTDEYSSLEGAPEKEINPMLGFHGVRFSLKHFGILQAELKAMRKVASANHNKKIGIMFPQVISIEEVKEAKKYFDKVKLSNMEFGVMIETPASVQIIEDICEEVDFISFGTNDLTQYTLAVDRNNEDVQYLYNELHPAVFSQIEKVIDACNSKGVETSICGQAGSKKEMVEFLFKKGIKSISVNADAAAEISQLIKELEDKFDKEEEVGRERLEKAEREEMDFELKRKEIIYKPKYERDNSKNIIKFKQDKESGQIRSSGVQRDIDSQFSQKTELNINNLSEEDLRKKLWKLKKQRRWKEFNRLKREMKKRGLWEDKKEERGEKDKGDKRDSWNKKAQLGDLDFEDNGEGEKAEIINENIDEIKQDKRGGLINIDDVKKKRTSEKVQIEDSQEQRSEEIKGESDKLLTNKKIEAEMHEEKMKKNIGPIEPFGSTERIDEMGRMIQEDVKEKNKEELEEEKDRIEVSGGEVEEESEQGEKSELEDEQPEKEVGEISSEAVNQEGAENFDEENIGSDFESAETIGVYNPDENSIEEKKRFKYNFDDWG